MSIYRYSPFHGDELLFLYNGLKDGSLGHLCDACDHCSLLCADLPYPGAQHHGGGWCWHPAGGKSIPENLTGICLQACARCLKVVTDFHFIMRMIGTQYGLPKDVWNCIAQYIPFPMKVLRIFNTGLTTVVADTYFEDEDTPPPWPLL